MKTITYTNNQGLELKINKFSSGQFKWAFSLTFNNGVHTFCYTMTELRTILLKNGMTRKWAADVKDRFDPLTEEHVLIKASRGGTYIHGAHLVREEDQPQLYPGSHHSTAVFRGRKICLCAQLKICPRVWLVERQSRSSGMAGKDPGL